MLTAAGPPPDELEPLEPPHPETSRNIKAGENTRNELEDMISPLNQQRSKSKAASAAHIYVALRPSVSLTAPDRRSLIAERRGPLLGCGDSFTRMSASA